MVKPLKKARLESSDIALQSFPGRLIEFPQTDMGNSRIPCGKWARSLSSTEIAQVLSTDRRNITNWFPVIRQAYCWMAESELRTGAGKGTRYTPFCCEQFELLMAATGEGKSYDDWVASIHATHSDQYNTWLAIQSTSEQDVIDAEPVEEVSQLTTFADIRQATPLIQLNFQTLNVNLQSTDTADLQQQTQQAQQATSRAAEVLQQAVSAKFKSDIAQVIAQNENLAAGIQATAVVGAIRDLGLGKPSTAMSSCPGG